MIFINNYNINKYVFKKIQIINRKNKNSIRLGKKIYLSFVEKISAFVEKFKGISKEY